MTAPRKIFISYRSLDVDFVKQLYADLKAKGFEVWWDKNDIRPGDSWQVAIEKGLQSSTHMVVVLTPESVASSEVMAEWSYFLDERKPIYPLLLRSCAVPYRLRLIQWIDFSKEYAVGFERLMQRVDGDLTPVTVLPAPVSTPPSPDTGTGTDVTWNKMASGINQHVRDMLGMRYHDKYNPDYYFQRNSLYKHFEDFLKSDKTVMCIIGKAGTGKSSFVCSIAQTPPANVSLWLQDCGMQLDVDDVGDYVLKTLQVSGKAREIFEKLCENEPSHRLVLLFDAVNENASPLEFLAKLKKFILQLDGLPNVKVIVTCRIPMWDIIKHEIDLPLELEYHTAGPGSYVNVDTYEDADLEQVYKKYAQVYNLRPRFDQLSEQVRKFISQPLFLKLAAVVYRNKEIPRTLILSEIFEKYIEQALGKEGIESREYQVLRRVIQLMYEHAQRELSTQVLKQDEQIGVYITPIRIDPKNPYVHLLDQGVLSRRDEQLLRKIEMIFVTYERIFEYLLADIIVGSVDVDQIQNILKEATMRSFPQLRGAVELAVTFAILHNRLSVASVVKLAEYDQPESRQFLVDVIETVDTSGFQDLRNRILDDLIRSPEPSANYVAVQATYQLKLDDRLVNLAMSQNPVLKDTAAIYLYERWNKSRLSGSLSDGYEIIQAIVNLINLRNVRRIAPAVSTLLSLSFNLSAHIIDDPQSLTQLIEIYRNLVRAIPGLEPRTDRSGITKFFAENVGNLLIEATSQVVNRLAESTIINNNKYMHNLFNDMQTKQVIMDICNFADLESLEGYEEVLFESLTMPNPLIPWMYRGVMMHFVYHDPERHIAILEALFYRDGMTFPPKLDIAYSVAFGSVFRLMRNQETDYRVIEILENMLVEIWEDFHDILERLDNGEEVGGNEIEYNRRVEALLTGIFTIEAMIQQRTGEITGSEFLRGWVRNPLIQMTNRGTGVLLRGLEKFSYRGLARFAMLTLLDNTVRGIWDNDQNRHLAVEVMSKLRAFYQEEIDTILKSDSALWEEVRVRNAIPVVADVRSIINSLWTGSAAVERLIMKTTGVIVLGLILSGTTREFIERAIRTVIAALFDPRIFDTAIVAWFKTHNPDWNGFEKWEISPDIAAEKPEIYQSYKTLIEDYVKQNGKGRLYEQTK